jgi:acylphosphatase
MIVARRFVVSGRVQGVGFRYFVREAAGVENVGGWVRNLQDGRVEVFAEGELASVDRLERRLRRGPPAAHVETVEVFEDEAPSPSRPPFTIKSTA